MALLKHISRNDAKAAGLKLYFTGLPCKNGHIAERCVSNFTCCICKRDTDKRLYQKNANKFVTKAAGWKKANKKRVSELNSRPEKVTAARIRSATWREANREKHNKYSRGYYQLNKDRYYTSSRVRRARKQNADGSFTRRDAKRILELQRGKCANCSKNIATKYHADHIIPLSKGGDNWPLNIQILCQRCNNKKYNKDPIQWAQEQGRLL